MKRLDTFNWSQVESELDAEGHATLRGLLTASECRALAEIRPDADAQTSSLESLKQGSGEIYHFRTGVPAELTALRASLYERLVGTANRWQEGLGEKRRYPERFGAPRPLAGNEQERSALSRLRAGHHWGLHKDIEGEPRFALQASALLSRPDRDFSGGEFVMTELRPRMQSRPIVLVPEMGDMIIFAADARPFRGKRGPYRVSLKHAISRIRHGERAALELLF